MGNMDWCFPIIVGLVFFWTDPNGSVFDWRWVDFVEFRVVGLACYLYRKNSQSNISIPINVSAIRRRGNA